MSRLQPPTVGWAASRAVNSSSVQPRRWARSSRNQRGASTNTILSQYRCQPAFDQHRGIQTTTASTTRFGPALRLSVAAVARPIPRMSYLFQVGQFGWGRPAVERTRSGPVPGDRYGRLCRILLGPIVVPRPLLHVRSRSTSCPTASGRHLRPHATETISHKALATGHPPQMPITHMCSASDVASETPGPVVPSARLSACHEPGAQVMRVVRTPPNWLRI